MGKLEDILFAQGHDFFSDILAVHESKWVVRTYFMPHSPTPNQPHPGAEHTLSPQTLPYEQPQ